MERTAIVVGAGVMGASAAWGLHRRGWRVTLLEQGPVPDPRASSAGVHRLIRTPYGARAGYAAMVLPAYDAWDLLWADLGRSLYTHTGMLVVDRPEDTWGRDATATLATLGLPHEVLDAAACREVLPGLRVPDGSVGLRTDDAGFLRAGEIVAALGDHLRAVGVDVRDHTQVAEVDPDAATVVLADGTRLGADRLVVAAGPWTGRLLPARARDLTPSRQVVVDLAPPDDLVAAWDGAPSFLLFPAYGVAPRDGLPLKVGDHHFSMQGQPDDPREPRDDEVAAVMDLVRDVVVDLDRYELLDARTCYYTVADDEEFHVTPIGERGALMAGFTGHGFKFGTLMGLGVAAALDEDAAWAELTPWAAGRRTGLPFRVA